MHDVAAAVQFSADNIEAATAKADVARPRIRRRATLQHIADTQDQLARFERLRQVVVRSLLEPVDAILRLGHRGQQQDRNPALAAQRTGQLQPALSRHHDVEHDEIEGEARQGRPRLARVPGGRHPEAAIRQIPAQELSQACIIVHDKQMGLGQARHAGSVRRVGSQRIAGMGLSKRRRSSSPAMIPSSTVRKVSTAAAPACR